MTSKGWKCPMCKRPFTRANQRHACGRVASGERPTVLRNRPPELVAVYFTLEAFANSLGSVEFVARDLDVLFRTTRIFADVVVMAACIRVAIHLPRQVNDRLFSKIVADERHVTHVALLRDARQITDLEGFLLYAENSRRAESLIDDAFPATA